MTCISSKSSHQRPSVFNYDDYAYFLADYLEFLKTEKGFSYRQLSRQAGFKSPNYLQKIAEGQRNLTAQSALKLADAMLLNEEEARFFCLLVERDSASGDTQALQHRMNILRNRANAESSSNTAIFNTWLHSVLWELVPTLGPEVNIAILKDRLGHVASAEAIEASFNFLIEKGYLQRNEARGFVQRPIIFNYPNDSRRDLEIQRTHNTYLKMAQHRLNDSLSDREFQGLTISVSASKMPEIKLKIRTFLSRLSEELADDDLADQVIRIQFCAFRITK